MTPIERTAAAREVRVWDLPVRLLHWSLVGALLAAWVTSSTLTGWHDPAGYAALAIVAMRLAWGFVGGRHARFAGFVASPSRTLRYARLALRRREPRHLGHNPLGGWMIVLLLLCVVGVAASGWLFTTDAFWGDATVQSLHRRLAWGLLALVVVHVGGVAYTSRRQNENLVAAMFSGRKREALPHDVA